MNRQVRRWLEQNGLRTDATEQEAWDLYDELKDQGITLEGVSPGTRSGGDAPATDGQQRAAGQDGDRDNGDDPPPTPQAATTQNNQQPGQRTYDAAQVNQMIGTAMVNERQRISEITSRARVAGVAEHDNGDFLRSMTDDPMIDVNRAAEMIFERMQQNPGNQPFGTGAQVGREASDKFRDAVTHGLMLRSGIAVADPVDGAREFRGRSMLDIGREMLIMAGENVRGLGKMDLAGRILSSRSITGLSTSDFGLLLAPVVNKVLLAAYEAWPATWRPFVAITDATDFKAIHALKLSGAPDLQGMNENGEYKTASFSESGETYNVITKGIRVMLTRQMLINDDLRAFTRIPQLFGGAARRMENAAVYNLITANGAMSDGKALFHADHNNLAGTGTAISSDSLGVARSAMRRQKGLNNEPLNIVPAFLLVPTTLETQAEILLRSTSLPDDNKSAGVHNPWSGKLDPITDPLLDEDSETAWYELAHPNQAPVIEVAYLEGEEQPYVEEQVDFNSDSLVIKTRHDFGAGAVDHVGGYKNPGA